MWLENIFNELEEVQNVGKYNEAEKRIKLYIEIKYKVKVHRCRFSFNKQNHINMINIYLTTTKELNLICIDVERNLWLYDHPEDVVEICNILESFGLAFKLIGYGVLYDSFEQVALYACYAEALKERKKLREKYFNSETMEIIHDPMFVVYKTKEDMEKSKLSGEQERIKEEFYQFIKKYDKYNYITKEKHLLVHFDYAENARSPRLYSDLYSTMLQTP